MEAEESVEVEDLILRNGNAGTHLVIVLLAIRDDDVEPVGCAALEDHDKPLIGCRHEPGSSLGQDRAYQEAGNGSGAGYGERAVSQEESTIGLHGAPQLTANLQMTYCSTYI